MNDIWTGVTVFLIFGYFVAEGMPKESITQGVVLALCNIVAIIAAIKLIVLLIMS